MNIIKKTESRRQTENQLKIYHQAWERLMSGNSTSKLKSGSRDELLEFISQRTEEKIKELL